MFLLFLNLQCYRKGIIKGGSYIGKDNYNINAYYLYDFVTMDKVREHATFSSENDEGIVINYYFSHNSNIPSQSLEFSTDLNNAKELAQKAEKIAYSLQNCLDFKEFG